MTKAQLRELKAVLAMIAQCPTIREGPDECIRVLLYQAQTFADIGLRASEPVRHTVRRAS
jgi:hypothetical protein